MRERPFGRSVVSIMRYKRSGHGSWYKAWARGSSRKPAGEENIVITLWGASR